MKIPFLIATTLLALSAPPSLQADPASGDFRRWCVSFSPLHLGFPMLEVTTEYLVAPKWGLAAVGGIGSVTQKETDIFGQTTEYKYRIYDAGGQFRFYPINPARHAPMLGGEFIWLHISGDQGSGTISAAAGGISTGPFAGYKFTANSGFTFDSQLGYQFMAVRAQASDNQGNTASNKAKGDGVLLNINLGWTF